MTQSEQVEMLVRDANQYAMKATRSDPPCLERTERAEALRIQRLFPDLSRPAWMLLVRLRLSRLALTLLCNTPPEEFQEDPELESIASEAEQLFMDAKLAVSHGGIVEKLSPIQKIILKVEFLNIDFNH